MIFTARGPVGLGLGVALLMAAGCSSPEKLPVRWGSLLRVLRRLELRGEVRGGRFVAGFSGEQFALPEVIAPLRKLRRQEREGAGAAFELEVQAADPLNLRGVLTPDERVARNTRQTVSLR